MAITICSCLVFVSFVSVRLFEGSLALPDLFLYPRHTASYSLDSFKLAA